MLLNFNRENHYCNKSDSDKVRDAIQEWVISEYGMPSHMPTIQSPMRKKSTNLFVAKEQLRLLSRDFEYCLLGQHWYKHPQPFVAFAEVSPIGYWHFHLLMKCNKSFDEERLDKAITGVWNKHRLDRYSLHIEKLEYTPENVIGYCTKQITANISMHFDSDRIIPSLDLFDTRKYAPRPKCRAVRNIANKGIPEYVRVKPRL